VVINLFNFCWHYKSPPFHTVIHNHLNSLSYYILVILPSHFSSMEQMLMLILLHSLDWNLCSVTPWQPMQVPMVLSTLLLSLCKRLTYFRHYWTSGMLPFETLVILGLQVIWIVIAWIKYATRHTFAYFVVLCILNEFWVSSLFCCKLTPIAVSLYWWAILPESPYW